MRIEDVLKSHGVGIGKYRKGSVIDLKSNTTLGKPIKENYAFRIGDQRYGGTTWLENGFSYTVDNQFYVCKYNKFNDLIWRAQIPYGLETQGIVAVGKWLFVHIKRNSSYSYRCDVIRFDKDTGSVSDLYTGVIQQNWDCYGSLATDGTDLYLSFDSYSTGGSYGLYRYTVNQSTGAVAQVWYNTNVGYKSFLEFGTVVASKGVIAVPQAGATAGLRFYNISNGALSHALSGVTPTQTWMSIDGDGNAYVMTGSNPYTLSKVAYQATSAQWTKSLSWGYVCGAGAKSVFCTVPGTGYSENGIRLQRLDQSGNLIWEVATGSQSMQRSNRNGIDGPFYFFGHNSAQNVFEVIENITLA